MSAKSDILLYVVEDNKIYNRMVVEFLKKEGYTNVKSFLTGEECIKSVVNGESPDIVIQDYFLSGFNGAEVLQRVKKHSKHSEFIFLTANENMEVAVNTIKYGAYDYIIKESDVALKKVLSKIEKIEKLLELEKRNKVIKTIMTASLFILIAIVIFSVLHFFFDTFGLKKHF